MRPRITVDGRALTEPVGGLRRYAEEVLSRIAAMGADLDWNLIAQKPIPAPHGSYSLTVLPGSLNALARPLWEDLRLAREVRAGSAAAFFSPYGIVPDVGIPVISMVHDLVVLRLPTTLSWSHRMYWRRVARRLPRARRVLTNSSATADDVMALLSVPEDQITVTHLAPSSVFAPADPAQVSSVRKDLGLENPYVLAAGAGTPRKDLAAVAEAVAFLPDVQLITVGRAPVTVSARHLGVADDTMLSILMSGALAVVCPSMLEGFGLPVIEAMACGAPVIASRTPAVEEVADKAAILISGPDVAAWRHAVEGLLGDPQLRQKYREAGLARSKRFSWDTTASLTLDVIRSVLPDPGGCST